MRNRINGLGLICSLLIPALGILNRDAERVALSTGQLLAIWLVLSAFLLIIWGLNLRITSFFRSRPQFTTAIQLSAVGMADLVVIFLFFEANRWWFSVSFEGYVLHSYQLFIRLNLAVLLLSIIQYAFLSTMQREVLKRQNEQLRNENLVAELEGLKQQVNPHFLFNSLGTLRAMIHEKDENAEQYVLRLSAVYRQFLSNRNEPTTTLSDELDFLNNYLFMLRFRYENRLQLNIDVDRNQREARLPMFCLQLLVENCIKHNSLSEAKPLAVRIYQTDSASITVENNKQPKLSDVDSTGIGLANLRKRYRLLGLPNAVSIRDDEHVFAISVALIKP